MTRRASGERVRPACHITHTSRGRIAGSSSWVHSTSSSGRMSTASIGITAAPMPARTIDVTAPLSAVRNTISGSTPSRGEGVLDPAHVAQQARERHHLDAVELLAAAPVRRESRRGG